MAMECKGRDLQMIAEILGRILDRESTSIDVEEDMYQAGLTSIMVLPLLVELESSFQIMIPDAEFIEARTPSALARLIGQLRDCSSTAKV